VASCPFPQTKVDALIASLPAGSREYWAPRFHYSLLALSDLKGSWLPSVVKAWSRPRPTVRVLLPGDGVPLVARIFDAAPTVGKWAEQLDEVKGGIWGGGRRRPCLGLSGSLSSRRHSIPT
jgi:hypothetical protein